MRDETGSTWKITINSNGKILAEPICPNKKLKLKLKNTKIIHGSYFW